MQKVSIIIPCFNAFELIEETLNSAFSQTYSNIETIVIDDGSTDGSYEYLQSINKPNFILKKNKGKGACAARNYGFQISTGDYIMYLDADDMISEDKIRNQMGILEKNDDLTLVSCAWGKLQINYDEAKFIQQKIWSNYKKPINWLLDAWNGGGMMQTACWLSPRKLIEKAGSWNEDLKQNPNDDGEFFCRVILACSKIIFDHRSKVYYRIPQSNNVSQNKSYTAIESLLGSFKSHELEILKVENSINIKKALGSNYLNFIYQYHDLYPDLAKEAEKSFYNLKVGKMWPVGGKRFKSLAKMIGFKNAIGLKKLVGQQD